MDHQLLQDFQDFLKHSIPPTVDLAQVEIEAKFGRFIDKNSHFRVNEEAGILPVGSKWYRFDSELPANIHAFLNKQLNSQIKPNRLWTYAHTKTIDTTYGSRVRVTRSKTDPTKVLECLRKTRLADLALHLPHLPVDIRISINLEAPVEPDFDALGPVEAERQKDRRSYTDTTKRFRYDLTEVLQKNQVGGWDRKLELEMEALEAGSVINDPSSFFTDLFGFAELLK